MNHGTSCGLGVLRGEADDTRSYALALVSAMRLRVDEKGMVSAVRYDVDCGRTAGEAKNDQITQLRPRRSGHNPELSPTLLAYVAGGDVARAA